MPTVLVDDANVALRVDGTGPGLVLVHGTGGNSETNWGQLVDRLSRSRTVVRPDYSGSGQTTDGNGPLTIAKLAKQVVATAEEAGVGSFDLSGFSLGAAVATYIAAEYPDRVRSLVLLAGLVATADARQIMQFELWRDLIRSDRRAMARIMLLSGFSPGFLAAVSQKDIESFVDLIVETTNWDGMARQVELDFTIDVRDQARRVVAPTLVIGCRHDQMLPTIHARELASLIPGANYTEIDTGHLASLEKPDEVTDLILGFIEKAQA